MHDFGMELDAVEAPLRILEGGNRRVLGCRDHPRAGRRLDDCVAVRHPDRLILGEGREQLPATGCAELRSAELGDVGAVDPTSE